MDDHVGEEFGLPPADHNQPPLIDPDRLDAMRAKISEWTDAAGEWLDAGAITSDEDAGKVADLTNGARALMKRIEATRKDLKEPHLEAGRKIDSEFRVLTAPLDKLVERVGKLSTDWLKAKRDAAEKVRLAAIEEARKAAAEAEAARMAALARNDLSGEAAAEEAAAEAQEAAKVAAEPVKVNVQSASGGGRALGLRTSRRVRVIHSAMAFMACRDDASVLEAIEKCLSARVRSATWDGVVPAGTELIVEEKAA
jgi:hypothetical protein